MACKGNPWWVPLEVTVMENIEREKEAYLRKHSDVNDPLNPRVKHIVHHNSDGTEISKKTNGFLQKKINKAISKIMDMNLSESDRRELIKILTE